MELIIKLEDSQKYKMQNVYKIISLPCCMPSWLNNHFELDFDYVLDGVDIRTLRDKYLSEKLFEKIKCYIKKQEISLDRKYISMFHEHICFLSGFGYTTFYFIKDLKTDKEYIQSDKFTLFDDKVIANVDLFDGIMINNFK